MQRRVHRVCWWGGTCQLSLCLKVALHGRICVIVSAFVIFFRWGKGSKFPFALLFVCFLLAAINNFCFVRSLINLSHLWSFLSNRCISEHQVKTSTATSLTCYTGSVILPACSWKFLWRSSAHITEQQNVQWHIHSLHIEIPNCAVVGSIRQNTTLTTVFKLHFIPLCIWKLSASTPWLTVSKMQR